MLIQDPQGVYKKLVCPDCNGDNIGESWAGGDWAHCFGHCMMDIRREDCSLVLVSSPEELAALSQDPY